MKKSSESKNALEELDQILSSMMNTPVQRRQFLAAVSLLMSACATSGCATSGSRMREGNNSGQETELTVDDEKRMAREAFIDMKKDYPVIHDPQLQGYVSGIGQRLVALNGLEAKPYNYTFTVVNVPYVNAFALPAGAIFVTAPLLAMAETEAELAGVVGHEVGHVVARHTAERIEAQKKASGSWLYAMGGGLLGGAAGFGLGKLMCPPDDTSCVAKAAVLGAAAGVGGGLLVQKYKFMANSREDEMEADRIGFKTSVRAGYNPTKVGDFYSKLQRMEMASKGGGAPMLASLADALSTHPPSEERVAQMQELANRNPAGPKSVTNSVEFDRVRKRAEAIVKAARV
jgi:predicted Zn-dependent protease